MRSAVSFLREHGTGCVVSLGCGDYINRIDNHLRLMLGCGLRFYVGIDRTAQIEFKQESAFSDIPAASRLMQAHSRTMHGFTNSIKVFPETHVEELRGIPCSVVVCQRVLPFKHWEHVIESMKPKLMLQEDLHGCELQDLGGKHYTRSRAGIMHYGLTAFRPWRIFPGERNLILWRRRDFLTCQGDLQPWWMRIFKGFRGVHGK